MKNLRYITLILTIIFCLSAITFGQGTTGKIAGIVTDINGTVIPNLTVTIKSTGSTTAYKKKTTTDKKGYYIFSDIPVGTYNITITANNFNKTRKPTTVIVDKVALGDLNLSPAGSSGRNIYFEKDSIDETSTNTDANVTKEIIDALPKGTSFSSILKVAPSVRPEANAGGFQVDGASGADNTFFIDGQEVTNFALGNLNINNNLPFELIQEVQVKSTGFEAEYAGSTGGVINAVTFGGNNQWRGNFGVSVSPNFLQGGSSPTLNRYGSNSGEFEFFTPNKDGGTDYFPFASISGPILKDKVWGLFSYAPQIYRTTRTKDYFDTSNPNRNIIQTETYKSTTRVEQAFARIDAQPFSSLRLFGTYLWNPRIDEGELPNTALSVGNAPISVSDYVGRGGRVNSNSVNGQATWTPFSWMVANFRAGRGFLNEKLNSYGRFAGTRVAVSTGSPLDPCNPSDINIPGRTTECRGFNTGSNATTKYDVSTRETFDADISLVGINFFGRHNLKGGYQYNKLYNDIDSGYTSTGYLLLYYGRPITAYTGSFVTPLPDCDFQNIPANSNSCSLGTARLVRIGTVGEASSENNAFYAQDSWTIKNRLTINYGFRIENEVIPVYSFADSFFSYASNEIRFGWKDKPAPRFGIAYDLTGDGKTKIFGSYGWFYDRFKYELPRGLLGSELFLDAFAQITPARGLSPFDYTFENMLGGMGIISGGVCPIVNGPGYVECVLDRRLPTNTTTNPFLRNPIEPNLKAMSQSEYTFGIERELGNNFVLAGRYTHKQLNRAIEDIGTFNAQGSEAYLIGNPGLGISCEISMLSNLPCTEAERKYDAVEVRLDKRAAKYFFNASYTWSRLFGNYSGLASSDEFGRNSPNTTRSFDLPMLGYNANGVPDNGLLATDRPHVFKAYGGYTFYWEDGANVTNFSGFTTLQSGTPITTVYTLYNVASSILFGRGDLGRTEMFTETDFAVSHRYKFGRDNRFTLEPFIEIQNIFDERNELSRDTSLGGNITSAQLSAVGCTTCFSEVDTFLTIFNGGIQQFVVNHYNANPTSANNTYNQPNRFQISRNVRFGFKFRF